MRTHLTARVATVVAGMAVVAALAGCSDDSSESGSQRAGEDRSAPRERTFNQSVTWKKVDGLPDPERVEAARSAVSEAVMDGGTAELGSCPLGEPEELFAGLPAAWSSGSELRVTADDFSTVDLEVPSFECRFQGRNRLEFAAFDESTDLSDEEQRNRVMDNMNPDGSVVFSEPSPLFAGSAFTRCYTNQTTGEPACTVTWLYGNVAVSGTIFGEGATDQIAADWFALMLPVVLGDADPGSVDDSALGEAYSIHYEDEDGYQLTADLRVRPAVRGADTERMAQEWSQIGGEGDPLCQDLVDPETSAFAFATLTVTNEVDGFSAPEVTWPFRVVAGDGELRAMGVDFSDGPRCENLYEGMLVTPTMPEDGVWGPVAVVFAHDGVFSPKHPDGDADLLAAQPVTVGGFTIRDSEGDVVDGITLQLAP